MQERDWLVEKPTLYYNDKGLAFNKVSDPFQDPITASLVNTHPDGLNHSASV
jgi:hypothetical protein